MNQMLHIGTAARGKDNLTLAEFALDRQIDRMILAAASALLGHTLRPLQRSSGGSASSTTASSGDDKLDGTTDSPYAVLNAVANRHVERAVETSDALIVFVDGMFETDGARI